MLVSAAWVVPMTQPPIEDGALVVRGDRVVEAGRREDLRARHPEEPLHDLGQCVVSPGLVNAHTHLALTALHDVVPPAPFHEWLPRIVRAIRALTPEDLAASCVAGAASLIASGTTVAGDIAYGTHSVDAATDSGLAGVHFFEVLGVRPEGASEHLAQAGYPLAAPPDGDCRVRPGISAHAPYTCSPELISALHARAARDGVPFAMHVAESPAEVALIADGTGPLAETAARSIPGFTPPGTTPVVYLDRLGALDGTLAIHCVHTASDAALLAKKAAGVVLCPRSNAYLHAGEPPAAVLDAAGVRLALGTDSLASNSDLDLFEEARALRDLAPGLSAERIVRMMTVDGAAALGMGARFGGLAPGMSADLAAFAVSGRDPYEALLKSAGRTTATAVMSGGVWRVLEGRSTRTADRSIASRLRDAAVRAVEAAR